MPETINILRQEYEDLMKQGRIEAAHRVLEQRDILLMDKARISTMSALGFDQFGREKS